MGRRVCGFDIKNFLRSRAKLGVCKSRRPNLPEFCFGEHDLQDLFSFLFLPFDFLVKFKELHKHIDIFCCALIALSMDEPQAFLGSCGSGSLGSQKAFWKTRRTGQAIFLFSFLETYLVCNDSRPAIWVCVRGIWTPKWASVFSFKVTRVWVKKKRPATCNPKKAMPQKKEVAQ